MIAHAKESEGNGTPTVEDVAGWTRVLISHGGAVEIRTIDARKKITSKVFPGGTDPRKIAAYALAAGAKGPNVYLTLNPIAAGHPERKAASDSDIAGRFWLLIDVDPKKPGDTSATRAEKQATRRVTRAIRDELRRRGWPEPIAADSGNGYHLAYRVELPNDDAAKELVKAALAALALRFDDDSATVDRTVYNASRICKFYGTVGRKGDSSEERPHRVSRILKIPDALEPVPVELLETLASEATQTPATVAEAPSASPMTMIARVGGGSDPLERARAYLEKIDPAISGQHGHDKTFYAACKMVELGLTEDQAFRLLWEEYNPRCEPPWTERELRHKVEDAFRENAANAGRKLTEDRNGYHGGNGKASHQGGGMAASGDGEAKDVRPDIELPTDNRHDPLRAALAALVNDEDLYRRGDVLVTIAREERDDVKLTPRSALKGMSGAPKVVALSPSQIGCRLTRVARFYRWRKDKSGEDVAVNAAPPDWLINAVATNGSYPGIRPLLTVVECPYPRPDGSIVETPGYDPETGAFYRPSMAFPPVPSHPTKADARAAAERILGFVSQFPFKSDKDRSVWLASLLTGIARPAIDGPVPGTAINGNVAGCGKGLLVDVVGLIATGRPVPTSSYPDDKEEAAKVKVALALTAQAMVHFDNLEEGTFYGNSALDSALTAITVNDRILGQSKTTGDVVLRTTWFLTGNNVSPGKDAYRRWLPCNLVSPLECPEEREDIKVRDLRGHVLEHRGEIVRDALTILRAHVLAGRPAASKAALGSFEQWDMIVRGAVKFAYDVDPCETRREAAEESPDRQWKLALMEGWRELPTGGDGGKGVTAEEAIRLAMPPKDRNTQDTNAYPGLRSALMSLSRNGEAPSVRSVGNRIRAFAGANVGNYRFEKCDVEHRVARWRVVKVNPDTPGGQESGESTSLDESKSAPSRPEENVHSYDHGIQNGASNGAEVTPQTRRLTGGNAIVYDPDDEFFGTDS